MNNNFDITKNDLLENNFDYKYKPDDYKMMFNLSEDLAFFIQH
jgi:hypothetical protein